MANIFRDHKRNSRIWASRGHARQQRLYSSLTITQIPDPAQPKAKLQRKAKATQGFA